MTGRAGLHEERIHGSPVFPFARYVWEGGTSPFQVQHHWHREFEIIYLEQGQFSLSVNIEQLELSSPALIFIAGGDIHSISLAAAGREQAIVFAPEILIFKHSDEVENYLVSPLEEGSLKIPRVLSQDTPGFSRIEQAFLSVCAADMRSAAHTRIQIRSRLLELFALLDEEGLLIRQQDPTAGADGERLRRLKKMLGFIKEHYREPLCLNQAAAILGMNSQYFCRFFHKTMGITFTKYMNELRIEACARQIAQTNRRIIDIAMENGFENVSYFMRLFRRSKQISPTEYRKRFQI